MLKKYLTVTCITIGILLIAAACQSDGLDDNNHTSSENEPAENEIALPDAPLQKLDEGKSVKMLQKTLNELGYDITTKGVYDEETTWAITDLQLQAEDLLATGIYNEETKAVIEKWLDDASALNPGDGLPQEAEPVTTDAGTEVVANPYDQLVLVNKHSALPDDFEPEDLVVPDVRFPFDEDVPKKQMRQVEADALEDLFAAGDEAGVTLYAQSGYRAYDTQEAIFASYVDEHGEDEANNFSARPGESEHQSGLTMDVTSEDVDFQLTVEFAETEEGKWLKENAAEFGFIIRYPEDKEDITEYQNEPWHLRYVGKKAAEEMVKKGLTLEEYLEEV